MRLRRLPGVFVSTRGRLVEFQVVVVAATSVAIATSCLPAQVAELPDTADRPLFDQESVVTS